MKIRFKTLIPKFSNQRIYVLLVVLNCNLIFLEVIAEAQTAEKYPAQSTLINQLFFLESDDHRFLMDTAGATYLNSSLISEYGWDVQPVSRNGELIMQTTPHSEFTLPTPLLNKGAFSVRNLNPVPPHLEYIGTPSGILGQLWFARRIISLDYKNSSVTLKNTFPDTLQQTDNLHFVKDSGFYFARLNISISGVEYPMLLQTGGFTVLSDTYKDQFSHSWIPSGFISESVYIKWKEEHPDWLILEQADKFYGTDIIRAENIEIAGVPILFGWFAVRRDSVYQEFFSQWTDETVVGGIGPDLFTGKKVILDFRDGKIGIE